MDQGDGGVDLDGKGAAVTGQALQLLQHRPGHLDHEVLVFNLTRQIGGSLGIAWLATLLTGFSAEHRAHLLEAIDPFTPAATTRLHQLSGAMMGRGLSAEAAQSLALRVLDGTVARASAELAFRDMFITIALLFVACLPLLLLLRRKPPLTQAEQDGSPAVVHAD